MKYFFITLFIFTVASMLLLIVDIFSKHKISNAVMPMHKPYPRGLFNTLARIMLMYVELIFAIEFLLFSLGIFVYFFMVK